MSPRRLLVPRDRLHTILGLGLPIIGGMVSQNVLNLVDTAMVGSLGDAALAGVGLGSFVTFMAQSFVMGLGSGVQAMAARRVGEGRLDAAARPLNGGLALALSFALPISVVVALLTPALFPLIAPATPVADVGIPYVQVRMLGVAAVGMNFAFRGHWNGVGRPGLYLRTLLVMHASNIVLNYLLIFGALGFPELGSTGAGLGTALATWIGTGTYIFLGLRHARSGGFLAGVPDRDTLTTMLRLSIPSGIQLLAFATGMTLLFGIIGRVGTAELAAANVVINVMLVAILPAMGLGLAAASLVGQALGRGDPDDAARWGWEVVRTASVVLFLLGLPMVLAPDLVLSAFIHDPDTIAVARLPLRLTGAFLATDALGTVLQNALLGAGASRTVMTVTVLLHWGLFLPAAWLVGPVLQTGLLGIWLAQIAYRLIQSLVFVRVWSRRAWIHARA
ncbi:MAG: MATE family efflux transporter [Myxococcota bacterium]